MIFLQQGSGHFSNLVQMWNKLVETETQCSMSNVSDFNRVCTRKYFLGEGQCSVLRAICTDKLKCFIRVWNNNAIDSCFTRPRDTALMTASDQTYLNNLNFTLPRTCTPHRPTRFLFAETLSRVLLPFQTVSWSDFLLADMMTSLSKGCADASRAVCSQITGELLCL